MSKLSRHLTLIAIAVIPSGLVSTPAGAESVTPTAVSYTRTITATRNATTLTGGGSTEAIVQTIKCTLNVGEYPHDSHHVSGTTNYVAKASCSSPVASLKLQAYLYPPIPMATVKGALVTTTQIAQANAAYTGCTRGTHQGYGYMSVSFPPGSTPSTGSAGAFGPSVYLSCA